MSLQERRKPRAFALAPPPAKAGGGWEGVCTVRGNANGTPPQPSPAFAGEGAKSAAESAPAGARRGPAYSAASGAPMLPRLYIHERSKQQARRMPEASLSQAVAMRLTRVSAFLPEMIQEIKSRRAPGVMSVHVAFAAGLAARALRSRKHTSELQSLMRISYAVF